VVVALCERLRSAERLLAPLDAIAGIETRALVCRNRRPLARFAAGVAYDALRRPAVLRALGSRRWRVSRRGIADEPAARVLRRWAPDVGLHGMSVIYRRATIEAFRLGILNPHIGLLPAYRGRSVMEWSLLEGEPTGITTFFIDEGIDTGERIVLRVPVDVGACADLVAAKRHLTEQGPLMLERAVRALTDPAFEPQRQRPEDGRRYYAMSRLFSGVVDELLGDG
jgi:folate-dependent phosphoribosylglycinamide formyltransferase PurN